MVRSGEIKTVADASWRKVTPCFDVLYDEPGSFSITSQCTSARVQMQDQMRTTTATVRHTSTNDPTESDLKCRMCTWTRRGVSLI